MGKTTRKRDTIEDMYMGLGSMPANVQNSSNASMKWGRARIRRMRELLRDKDKLRQHIHKVKRVRVCSACKKPGHTKRSDKCVVKQMRLQAEFEEVTRQYRAEVDRLKGEQPSKTNPLISFTVESSPGTTTNSDEIVQKAVEVKPQPQDTVEDTVKLIEMWELD